MPYEIKVAKGPRPFKIINKDTGKEVGSSLTKSEAERSIGYRVAAESKQKNLQSNTGRR